MMLGCIADDFSGATDLASALSGVGLPVSLVTRLDGAHLKTADEGQGARAVVVALKSRAVPARRAIEMSLEALGWLRSAGASTYYFKYCSTFDSTAEGNIGPVLDALSDELCAATTIVCPANPTQGRTVYRGHLFVGDTLLSDSPLADHPLNPMRESSLLKLFGPQTRRRLVLVGEDVVRRGPRAIAAALSEAARDERAYGVLDAIDDADLLAIAEAGREMVLLSGSAGLGAAFGSLLARTDPVVNPTPPPPRPPGATVVLAGSSSLATRTQLERVEDRVPVLRLDPLALDEGEASTEEALNWAIANLSGPGLVVAASATPQRVREVQSTLGAQRAGAIVESALGSIAKGLHAAGARCFVAAGGETSAAVVEALSIDTLDLAGDIEPGVPWMHTDTDPKVFVALKSGNFGTDAFFEKALGLG
jgi:uncharacterized protein YgbK (DUF1537 family)